MEDKGRFPSLMNPIWLSKRIPEGLRDMDNSEEHNGPASLIFLSTTLIRDWFPQQL